MQDISSPVAPSRIPEPSISLPNPAAEQVDTTETIGTLPFDHLVQFYDRDECLIDALVRYVTEGLAEQAAIVIVATEPHCTALERRLQLMDIDLDKMRREGTWLALGAAETLASLMVADSPDRTSFERHIGNRIQRLAADGRPVRAFGEMVALLWADGREQAAIELEELWNGLGRRNRFSLLCAYPINIFSSVADGTPFQQVCNCHSRIFPADRIPSQQTDRQHASPPTITTLQKQVAALRRELATCRRSEQALRRREVELSTFVETASLPLHWVASDGTILWANAAELKMLGYSGPEYIGRNVAEFHPDAVAIGDILARLNRGEVLRQCESRMRCKDGAIKTVLIDSSVYRENGVFRHSQCFTYDVTEQRRAEQAHRLLAAIVESSDDAIISKNLDGIIMSWNESAERIFGYTRDEIVGQHVSILIPPDRQDEEPKIISRLRRGERVDHFETIRRCKDSRLVEISLTISPVRDGSGRIVGASKIARDITDRRRSERLLIEAQEELARINSELQVRVEQRTASLREAVAQMEEFSYTVSHDLRAPLRAMQVYSEALLEDYAPKLDGDGKHFLQRIADSAERLDRMVLDVLTFSRVSRADLTMERVDVDRLARDLVQNYPSMQPPRAAVQIEPLAAIHGHEPSLTQIMSNLLANAVKFVSPGSMAQVRLRTERRGSKVRLWVEDYGIGIKPELQGRLFRMFERVHPDLPYEGTGVGLAIVKKAASRMNGEVGVESDGVHGSRFWVELPTAD